MAVKTFTTGEVLTAADTNTYLANGGLITIAGGNFSGASTIDITGFSTTYALYRLIFRARRSDAPGNATFTGQFYSGATAVSSGYYYGAAYANYLGASGSLANGNNVSNFFFAAIDSGAGQHGPVYEITYTPSGGLTWHGTGWYSGAAYSYFNGGVNNTSSAIDKIRLTPVAGTYTGAWILQAERTFT
jgi:hypothetical protein